MIFASSPSTTKYKIQEGRWMERRKRRRKRRGRRRNEGRPGGVLGSGSRIVKPKDILRTSSCLETNFFFVSEEAEAY